MCTWPTLSLLDNSFSSFDSALLGGGFAGPITRSLLDLGALEGELCCLEISLLPLGEEGFSTAVEACDDTSLGGSSVVVAFGEVDFTFEPFSSLAPSCFIAGKVSLELTSIEF